MAELCVQKAIVKVDPAVTSQQRVGTPMGRAGRFHVSSEELAQLAKLGLCSSSVLRSGAEATPAPGQNEGAAAVNVTKAGCSSGAVGGWSRVGSRVLSLPAGAVAIDRPARLWLTGLTQLPLAVCVWRASVKWHSRS